MESRTLALFVTLLLGIYSILGIILSFFIKKKKEVFDYLFSLALAVVIMLLFFDLLGEVMECLTLKNIWIFLLFSFLGVFLFKVLDDFVPEHHHDHETKEEEKENMFHIGSLTALALILHNITEGMAVYFGTLENSSLGVMMSLGIGLHNIPLGMMVHSVFEQSGKKNTSSYFYLLFFVISTFLGGIIPFLFHLSFLSSILMGILLSMTFGMLVYISIFELYPKVKESKNKKMSFYGIITGVFLFLLSLFIN